MAGPLISVESLSKGASAEQALYAGKVISFHKYWYFLFSRIDSLKTNKRPPVTNSQVPWGVLTQTVCETITVFNQNSTAIKYQIWTKKSLMEFGPIPIRAYVFSSVRKPYKERVTIGKQEYSRTQEHRYSEGNLWF